MVCHHLISKIRGSEKGWREGVGDWHGPKCIKIDPGIMSTFSWELNRKKDAERMPESLAQEGVPCANPSARQPLFQTSDKRFFIRFLHRSFQQKSGQIILHRFWAFYVARLGQNMPWNHDFQYLFPTPFVGVPFAPFQEQCWERIAAWQLPA